MIQLAQTLADSAESVAEQLGNNPDKVYFPNFGDGDNILKSGIDVDRVMFTIPGTNFKIYWYGFLIAVGIILAMIYGFRKMKSAGIDPDRATDAVIGGFFGAIIGARLYYVVFSDTTPISKFFDFRDGGLAVYGGILGAILVGGFIAKKKKLRLLAILDVAAPCFLIGQAIGRWGNFFNQECFGTNTDMPWGMISKTTADYVSKNITDGSVDPFKPIHPCFLYESLWCIVGFILLHLLFKHRKFDGELIIGYAGWYGLGRFFIEGLRTDSLYIGSVRASQLLAGLCFLASVAVIIVMRVRIHKYKDYVFFKDTELSREMILQYDNMKRFEKERRELKKKISEAKKNGEDTAELEKEFEEQFGEAAKKKQQEALEKAEQADIKAAAERKAARAALDGKETEEKTEEKKSEAKAEEKSEEKKPEVKAEEKSEEKKPEAKAEEKPEEKKPEVKAEEKPEEKKPEVKAEEKSEEKKTEAKAEAKSDEKKDETKTEEKPKQNNNQGGGNGQKKNNNNRNRNRNRSKHKNNNGGNKQGGQNNNNKNNSNSAKNNNKQGGNKNNNNNKPNNNKQNNNKQGENK